MMRHKGKITSWKNNKGFGFIAPVDGGHKVFIHISAFKNRSHRPDIGEEVSYSVTKDAQGRTKAVNATLAGDKLSNMSAGESSRTAVFFAWLFLMFVGISVFVTGLPFIVLGAYLFMSTLTYLAYAIDKSAAQAGRWRISEKSLQLLALAGGWPGALLAQQILRHKSRKGSFRIFLWIAVLLNCAGLAWLHTAEGRAFLQQLF
jgi:uncharacterized membrane protein YsdA (DUF1294 family)/cold shock CspA family protein